MKSFSGSWTFHQSRSDLFRSANTWMTYVLPSIQTVMISDAYLTIPLKSSPVQTRFCQTKRNKSCQCGAKNHFACFLSSPGFWMSRGCGSWFTVCPSHWLQTAELKCGGWNHTSKSDVPAEKLSEQNIWLDEVIKGMSESKFLQWTAAGCWGIGGDGQEKRKLNARS